MKIEYYNNKESVAEYIKMADGINARELIVQLNKYLESGSSVLELGSGPGSDWEILSKDYLTTGSDNSIQFLKHLNNIYPTGRFLNIDAANIDINESFDCIFSNKVLHHLQQEDLKKSIEKQVKVLNSRGIVCHSFWAGEGSEYFEDMFVQYYNEADLRELFAQDFEIITLQYYKEFDAKDSILLIAKKK